MATVVPGNQERTMHRRALILPSTTARARRRGPGNNLACGTRTTLGSDETVSGAVGNKMLMGTDGREAGRHGCECDDEPKRGPSHGVSGIRRQKVN